MILEFSLNRKYIFSRPKFLKTLAIIKRCERQNLAENCTLKAGCGQSLFNYTPKFGILGLLFPSK